MGWREGLGAKQVGNWWRFGTLRWAEERNQSLRGGYNLGGLTGRGGRHSVGGMNTARIWGWVGGILILFRLAMAGRAAEAGGVLLEDFEEGFRAERWSFSEGAEFPGAKGRFERAGNGAAHAGRFGGKLTFDFTGGGNYVAAAVRLSGTVAMGTKGAEGRGLRLWLQRPEGNDVVFRYTDAGGQTLQKPVECPAGRWVG